MYIIQIIIGMAIFNEFILTDLAKSRTIEIESYSIRNIDLNLFNL